MNLVDEVKRGLNAFFDIIYITHEQKTSIFFYLRLVAHKSWK